MGKICQLSVIIPAANEAENLKVILPSLIAPCNLNNWKIAIVNDGSMDNTNGYGLPVQINGHGTSSGSLSGVFAGIIFFLSGLIDKQRSLLRRTRANNDY